MTKRYVRGPGADETVVQYAGPGIARQWLYADPQGSVIAVADGAGSMVATGSYGPYGEPGLSMTGRFGYTGQAWLPETRLYYYKARLYAPKLGRFLQTDPVGSQAGLNLYDYADSDPINLSDPDGLTPIYGPVLPTLGGGNYDSPWSDLSSTITVTASYGRQTVGVGVPSFNATASARPAWMIAGPPRGNLGQMQMQMRPQKQTQCPTVPSGGPGAGQLNRNIQEALRQRRMNTGESWSIFAAPALEGGAGAWFAGQVKTGGAWDYKNQGYPGGRNFGNFNYGATGAALGYDWATTMGAAHAYSLIDTGGLEGESAQIRAGFEYARRGCE